MKRAAAAAADEQKRQRVVAIRYELPMVSQSALIQLCKWSTSHGGLPDITHARQLRGARDASSSDVQTPHGTLIKLVPFATVDGTRVQLAFQDPWAGLHEFISKSKVLSDVFRCLMETNPPSPEAPWRLILYSDEITPGNQLAHKNARKVNSIYYSFMEFGPLLANEDFWFTGTLIACSTVKYIAGGWSCVMATFCRQFWTPDGRDMEKGGVSIPLCGGGRIMLFVGFGAALADELALNMFYHAKGASGLKCCLICQNCFDAKTTRASVRTSTWAVLHTEHNFSKFLPHTPGTINAIVDRLRAAAAEGSTALKEAQTTFGFNYHPGHLLFDEFLRPKVQPSLKCLFDWMHVFFVAGVANIHIGRFMHLLRKTSFTYASVHAYLSKWTWPHSVGGNTGVALFSQDRFKTSLEARHLKATASEGRSLILPFAHFVRQSLLRADSDPRWRDHAEAICHLADAVQELEAAARGTCDGPRLKHHLEKHLELFVKYVAA